MITNPTKTGNNENDLGVVLYLCVQPDGKTYIDRRAQEIEAETLDASFRSMENADARVTAWHQAGRPFRVTAHVRVELNDETAEARVRLVSKYSNDSVLEGVDDDWALIQTTRQDSGVTAAEHVFSESGVYCLQTGSEGMTGLCRWEAQGDGLGADGFVRIAMRAG